MSDEPSNNINSLYIVKMCLVGSVLRRHQFKTRGLEIGNILISMTELASLSESEMLAKFVRGPLVRRVILSPGSSCFLTHCHTSKADGCRCSGSSELSGVYLCQYSVPLSHFCSNEVKEDFFFVYLLGLIGNNRASPYNVSESINPPLPNGIAYTLLQPRVGFPIAVVLPRPTGMSSRPIM